MASGDALIVVDLQHDFCEPGGALFVSHADALLDPTNSLLNEARHRNILIVLTQDWHPRSHASFASAGGRWPDHCVAGTSGALIHPSVVAMPCDLIIRKGCDAQDDGYSAFQGTSLSDHLRSRNVARVAICGVATEHCVSATASDAIREGFGVTILVDLVAPIDRKAGDRVLEALQRSGARLRQSSEWIHDPRP